MAIDRHQWCRRPELADRGGRKGPSDEEELLHPSFFSPLQVEDSSHSALVELCWLTYSIIFARPWSSWGCSSEIEQRRKFRLFVHQFNRKENGWWKWVFFYSWLKYLDNNFQITGQAALLLYCKFYLVKKTPNLYYLSIGWTLWSRTLFLETLAVTLLIFSRRDHECRDWV